MDREERGEGGRVSAGLVGDREKKANGLVVIGDRC